MKFKKVILFSGVILAVVAATSFYAQQNIAPTEEEVITLNRQVISEQIGAQIKVSEFPQQMSLDWQGQSVLTNIEYTLNPSLQAAADKLLKSYKPDYAAIVAIDPTTGQILTMSSFHRDGHQENLTLRGSFPAASIFKVVTATAAIDRYDIKPEHEITFNGGSYTLYKKNVLSDQINRWTRHVTLREAFARSFNTAFGRLGNKYMTPNDILDYATKYNFNRAIAADIPVEAGVAMVPSETGYQFAEVSSGFNKFNKMSPIQGAMIAAAIAQDGVMHSPYLVEKIVDEKNDLLYQASPLVSAVTMTPEAAGDLRKLMEATIHEGTSKKAFRPFVKDRKLKDVEVGGKTGSLTGDEPRGKVDWFVGYAIYGNRKIAIAAVTVNKEKWQVKSAHLAQSLFKQYYYLN